MNAWMLPKQLAAAPSAAPGEYEQDLEEELELDIICVRFSCFSQLAFFIIISI